MSSPHRQQSLEDGSLAAWVIPVLYLAWALSWGGTFMTTCTMGDPKSLAGALMFSCIPYAAAIAVLLARQLGPIGLTIALPLVPLMLWQAAWGFELFVLLNINGRNACNLMMGEEFGEADSDWFELLYAPYYVSMSLASVIAIAYSHWRYQRTRKKLSVRSDVMPPRGPGREL